MKYPSAKKLFARCYMGGTPPSLASGTIVAYGTVRKKPPRLCYQIVRQQVDDTYLHTIHFVEWHDDTDNVFPRQDLGRTYSTMERCYAYVSELQKQIELTCR